MTVSEEVAPKVVPLDGGGYDSSGKTPSEIEQDISETRAELGEILDALERELAPRHLLEKGFDMLKDSFGGDAGGSRLVETLRDHPLPLALIGAGVGWMAISAAGLFGRERDDGVEAAISPAGTYPTDLAGYASARGQSAKGMASDTLAAAQDAGAQAWDRASDYAGQASAQLSDLGRRGARLMQEQPLLIGALGLLAGAALALLLPRSRIEERVIGPAADQLRDKASELGREAVDRAQHVAERTVDAAVGAAKDTINEATGGSASGSAQHDYALRNPPG